MAPTLLQRGSLRGDPASVPVEAITARLRKHMPEFGDRPPVALRDRVFIAKSETGSGKSTVLPAHVFRLLRAASTPARQPYNGRSVMCTQPRVLTAVTLGRDMAASPNYPDLRLPDPLGQSAAERSGTVGYHTMPLTNKPSRGLIYATAGILLTQLRLAASQGDFSAVVRQYAFIIIDEAHERSLDIDSVLMLLKQMLLDGLAAGGDYARQLPIVILASATINVETYARFFDLVDARGLPYEDSWFHVVGRQHGIAVRWPAVGTNDYMAAAVAAASAVHRDAPDDPPDQRDVLIFVPGAAETRKIVTALEKARDAGAFDPGGPVLVLPINSEAVNNEGAAFRLLKAGPEALWQAAATLEAYPGPKLEGMRAAGLHPRRVVVSTVIAETGLTIETLKYVIDGGWQRASESYQPYGVQGLVTRPAARSRILQRKGRAGRLFPGVFLPLYTEAVYEALPEQQLPDIVTEGAGPVILDIVLSQQVAKRLRYAAVPAADAPPAEVAAALCFRAQDLDMLDAPPADAFLAALGLASALGFFAPDAPLLGRPPGGGRQAAVVGYGPGLTPLGLLAARFPRLPLEHRRLLLGASVWECAVSDLAAIAAVCGACAERGLGSLLSKAGRRAAATESGLRKALAPALVAGLRAGAGALGFAAGGNPEAARAFLQDDLIEGLYVFEGFRVAVEASAGLPGLLPDVEAWCEKNGLDYGAMVGLVEAREAALEEMIAAGLNPFWGADKKLVKAAGAEVATRVRALKRCIYDAFRLNELQPRRSARAGRVVHEAGYGLVVKCPSLASFGGEEAVAVAPALTLHPAAPRGGPAAGPAPLKWDLVAPMVSVLTAAVDAVRVAPMPALVAPVCARAAARPEPEGV